MIKLFWNFVKAFLRVKYAQALGYKILAEPETAEYRFSVCKDCPFFNGAQCKLCGCLAEAKTMILVEECPRRYWAGYWIKKNLT